MQNITATHDKRKNAIVLTVPLEEPRVSSTGRSMIVANTGNFVKVPVEIGGRQLSVKVIAITLNPRPSQE